MSFLQINIPFIHNPYVNIILRSLSVYLFMIVAIRIFGKKELAQLSVTDLVFILLISNAVQNAMVGQDSSLQGGVVAAITLFTVNYILKRILYKNKKISDLIQGEALLLIYKGEVQVQHCIKAEITMEELEAAVREHGVKDFQSVDVAMLEVDGNISIVSDDFQKQSTIVSTPKKTKFKGRVMKQ